MTEDINIGLLADQLAQRMQPSVPFELELWDLDKVAKYLHRNREVVRESMASLPGFPRAIRLPTKGAGVRRSHALYYAKEVVEWAQKYREKN